MHEGITLSLFGIVLVAILQYGPIVAALAVIIDAVRRPPADLAGSIPGGRLSWIAPNVTFLLVTVIDYIGVDATVLSYTVIALFVIVVVVDFAYLLRVAFPSPARRAARDLAATTIHAVPVVEPDREDAEELLF